MPVRMKDKGLINHLKRWGLNVEEVSGWRTRGRPYDFRPRAIFAHHDASSASSGNAGAIGVVTNGRTGLPGPLSQFVLGRDGTVYVVAAGYSNHAGYGGPRGGVPANMGNTYAVGIEAANNGVGERWPDRQLQAYYRLCAALMVWLDIKDVDAVFGHKEWTSRKIDPAGINMNQFRDNVSKALRHGPSMQEGQKKVTKQQQPRIEQAYSLLWGIINDAKKQGKSGYANKVWLIARMFNVLGVRPKK